VLKLQNYAAFLLTSHDARIFEFLAISVKKAVLTVETTFFPQTYHRFCHMIDRNRPYLLSGKVEEDWGAITLTVDRVETVNT